MVNKKGEKKTVDLKKLGYDKLLGGGAVKNGYSVKVDRFSATAEEKIKKAGGEVIAPE